MPTNLEQAIQANQKLLPQLAQLAQAHENGDQDQSKKTLKACDDLLGEAHEALFEYQETIEESEHLEQAVYESILTQISNTLNLFQVSFNSLKSLNPTNTETSLKQIIRDTTKALEEMKQLQQRI